MRPSVVSSASVPPAPAVTARSTASAAAGLTIAAMICPPSKASSMRIESSARADHLREDAVDGIGMEKSDLEPEQPAPRGLVDELHARPRETCDLVGDVVDLVCDVMHARAAARQEPPHGGVVPRRRQQLDPRLADEHRRRLYSLVADCVTVLEHGVEQSGVARDGVVEIYDGDPDVMHPAIAHAAIVVGRFRGGTR